MKYRTRVSSYNILINCSPTHNWEDSSETTSSEFNNIKDHSHNEDSNDLLNYLLKHQIDGFFVCLFVLTVY